MNWLLRAIVDDLTAPLLAALIAIPVVAVVLLMGMFRKK